MSYNGGMGDLPANIAAERGEPDQALPDGLTMPPDIAGQMRAMELAKGAPVGEPKKTVYTVSTYDSRPPNGTDIVLDSTFTISFTPPP